MCVYVSESGLNTVCIAYNGTLTEHPIIIPLDGNATPVNPEHPDSPVCVLL